MEEYVLERFIGTQTSRCSREQRRLLFIWRAGVSTSPLQLLAYKGLLPLKGFWVYVQAYGITLSSVLTAKHDSTASFWPEIKLQQNDKKQTSNLRGYYQIGAACVADEGNKVIGGGGEGEEEKVMPLYDYEKWFCALVCFISLHYNIYGLHTLQRHAELQ